MKLVIAVIRSEKLNETLEALFAQDVRGLTVSPVRGHGGEGDELEQPGRPALRDKVRLEIGVSDPFVETTVNAILGAARTGDVGDGKIFVLPVERIYRIRTGEQDVAAVTPVYQVPTDILPDWMGVH